MNDQAFAVSCRPSRHGLPRRRTRQRPTGVAELARRFERGLDLWTGEPLRPEHRVAQPSHTLITRGR